MAQTNSSKSGSRSPRRWLVWVGLAIVAVVLLASFVSRDDSVPVTVASVTRRNIRSVIATNGKIEPVRNFEAHAPLGTNIKRILVNEGDHVRRGQLLVELDAASARSQAAQAQAQLRGAEADISGLEHGGNQEEVLTLQAQLVKARGDYQVAQRNLDALQRLQQAGAASPGEVRTAQNQVDAASVQVKLLESKQKGRYSNPEIARVQAQQSEAQSAYEAAQDILSQLLIRAPFDGEVYSLPVKAGAYVNPGDLVLEEADLSKVLVRAYVDEPDIAKLATGERIELTWDAMPGRIWTGEVNSIPSTVKLHGARNVGETTCIVSNQDFKLLPNINVGVTIVTAEHDNVLTVPREALRQEDSSPYVFQVVDNELRRQNVQTSIANLTSVEIASGISENALVAVGSPNAKPLRDRLPVKVTH